MKTTASLVVILLLASMSLAACSSSDLSREAHPSTLTGAVWRAVSVVGRPPVAGSEPTIAFAVDQVRGSAGCNSFGGRYSYDPSTGSIAFEELAMTAMGCMNRGQMDVEGLFSGAMTQAASVSIDPEGRLVLIGPGGEIVLAVDAVGS